MMNTMECLPYLNNCYEAQSPVYTPEQLQVVRSIRESIAQIEDQIKQEVPTWESELKDFQRSILSSLRNGRRLSLTT